MLNNEIKERKFDRFKFNFKKKLKGFPEEHAGLMLYW